MDWSTWPTSAHSPGLPRYTLLSRGLRSPKLAPSSVWQPRDQQAAEQNCLAKTEMLWVAQRRRWIDKKNLKFLYSAFAEHSLATHRVLRGVRQMSWMIHLTLEMRIEFLNTNLCCASWWLPWGLQPTAQPDATDHANVETSHMFKSAYNPVRRTLASHDWPTGENRLGAVQNLMPPPCLVLGILPSWFVYVQWTTNDKNPYELDVQITLNRHMSYKGEHKLVNYRGLKRRLPVWLLPSHLLHVPGAKEWQVINSDLNSSADLFSMALHKQYWLMMLLLLLFNIAINRKDLKYII